MPGTHQSKIRRDENSPIEKHDKTQMEAGGGRHAEQERMCVRLTGIVLAPHLYSVCLCAHMRAVATYGRTICPSFSLFPL